MENLQGRQPRFTYRNGATIQWCRFFHHLTGMSQSAVSDSYRDVFEDRKVVVRVTNLPDLDDAQAVQNAASANSWAKDYIRYVRAGVKLCWSAPLVALHAS